MESTSSSSSGFYGVAKTLFSVLGIRFVLTKSWATGPGANRAVVRTSLAPAATHGPILLASSYPLLLWGSPFSWPCFYYTGARNFIKLY